MATFDLPNGEETTVQNWKEYLQLASTYLSDINREISYKTNAVVHISSAFQFFVPYGTSSEFVSRPGANYAVTEVEGFPQKTPEDQSNVASYDSKVTESQKQLERMRLPADEPQQIDEPTNKAQLESVAKDLIYRDLRSCLEKIHKAKELQNSLPPMIVPEFKLDNAKRNGLKPLAKVLTRMPVTENTGRVDFLVLSSVCGIILVTVKGISKPLKEEALKQIEEKVRPEVDGIVAILKEMCKHVDVAEQCIRKITVFANQNSGKGSDTHQGVAFGSATNRIMTMSVNGNREKREQLFHVLFDGCDMKIDSALLCGLSLLPRLWCSGENKKQNFQFAQQMVIETWKDFSVFSDFVIDKVIPEFFGDTLSVLFFPQKTKFVPARNESKKNDTVLEWEEVEQQTYYQLLADLPEIHKKFQKETICPPVLIRGLQFQDAQGFGTKSLLESLMKVTLQRGVKESEFKSDGKEVAEVHSEVKTDFLILSPVFGIVILDIRYKTEVGEQKMLNKQQNTEGDQSLYSFGIMEMFCSVAGVSVPITNVILCFTKSCETITAEAGQRETTAVDTSSGNLCERSTTIIETIVVDSKNDEKTYDMENKIYNILYKLSESEHEVNYTNWKTFVGVLSLLPSLNFMGLQTINLSNGKLQDVQKAEVDTEKLIVRKTCFHLPNGEKKHVQTWKDFVDTADCVIDKISDIFNRTNSVGSIPSRYEFDFKMNFDFVNEELPIKPTDKQNMVGADAEQVIYNQLMSVLREHNRTYHKTVSCPSVVITRLKINDEKGSGTRTLVESFINEAQLAEMETDMVLLSTCFGIVVFEIKNITTANVQTAKQSISKAKQEATYAAFVLKKLSDMHRIFVPIRKIAIIYLQPGAENIRNLCKTGNTDDIITLPVTTDMNEIAQRLSETLEILRNEKPYQVDGLQWKRFMAALGFLPSIKFLRGGSQAEIDTLKLSEAEMVHKDLESLQTQEYLTQGCRGHHLKHRKSALHGKWYFLSNSQKKIIDDKNKPSRQLLIGPPGTGKTLLLMLKVQELVNAGKSVAVFAPPEIREFYKSIIENQTNCAVYDLRELMWDKNSVREILAQQVKRAVDFQKAETQLESFLCRMIGPNDTNLSAFRNIIIDELGILFKTFNKSEEVNFENFWLGEGFLNFMKQCEGEGDKSIWVAGTDSCFIGNVFSEMDFIETRVDKYKINSVRDESKDYENCLNMIEKRLSLNRVNLGINFRNSEKIAGIISAIHPKAINTYQIACAHKIPGSVRYYDLTDDQYNPRVLFRLLLAIKQELGYYCENQKLSRDQVKVLLLGNDIFATLAPLAAHLSQYWGDHNILGASGHVHSMEWPAVILVLFSNLSYSGIMHKLGVTA